MEFKRLINKKSDFCAGTAAEIQSSLEVSLKGLRLSRTAQGRGTFLMTDGRFISHVNGPIGVRGCWREALCACLEVSVCFRRRMMCDIELSV